MLPRLPFALRSPADRPAAGGTAGAPLSPELLRHALARAATLQQQGRLQEAADACAPLLRADPDNAAANHLLGLIFHQAGRDTDAAPLLAKAVAREPSNPVYRSNLGVVLQALGRLDEAAANFEAALRLDSHLAATRSNLGVALLGLGRRDEAIAAQRQAIADDPAYPEAHVNLGLALRETGDLGAAIACFQRAIALRPGYGNAHTQLAITLLVAGRPDAALAAAGNAVTLQPDSAAAHGALAGAQHALNRVDDAIASYRRAVALAADAVAYRNLARLLFDIGEFAAAAEAAHASTVLNPDDAGAHLTLGKAQASRRRHRLAVESLRRARELAPDDPAIDPLLATSLIETGAAVEGLALLRAGKAAHPNRLAGRRALVFTLNYLGDTPIPEMVAEAKSFGELLAAPLARRQHHANSPDPNRRLRIGFMSGDFREHPVARFLLAVLPALDREAFELFGYQTTSDHDELTPQFKAALPNWREVWRLTDSQADALIVADGIDILVDLSGLSAGGRLGVLAHRPAPVAVTWLGYFATTGLRAVDYVLANNWVIPPEEEDQWVERPWRLPETYLCFARPAVEVPLTAPPSLANGFVTFGSANNINKLSAVTVACWADVLRAVPDSRLLLRAAALGDAERAEAVHARFAERGVGAERLILQPAVKGYAEHLARYGDVDIALDPFPYAGGTTSVEALWMGAPVLTLRGDRYVAHMGENILHNMNMPEWIAADTSDYVRKAVAAAAAPAALATLRPTLRPRLEASPLMDAPRFGRHLETAFRGMWQKWCAEHPAG